MKRKPNLDSKEDLEKLIKESKFSLRRFIEQVVFLMNVVDLVNFVPLDILKSRREEIQNIHRQNFVINLVSQLEAYLKELILEFQDDWKEAGVKELLSEKITLHQAFELTKVSKLRPVHFIVHNASFNSLSSFEHYFKHLFGNDILYEIDKKISRYDLSIYQNWKREFSNLYLYRNKFVHEANEPFTITQDNMNDFSLVVIVFAQELYNYTSILKR